MSGGESGVKIKVVADDKIPFLKGALESRASVVYLPGGKITIRDLDGVSALIVRTRTKCGKNLLDGSPVRFIATATIGYDHIDTAHCGKNGVFWTNAPGCNSASVAQYMTSALLKLALKYKFSLKGKTLGVAGVGNVGSKVAEKARALGMRVLLNDPPRERKEGKKDFVSLDTVLAESDFVSLHTPLEHEGPDKTFHLADGAFFSRIKKGAFFINASRGEVTDEAALKAALKTGKISGAVLDVWENEPDIDRDLLGMLDFATPHIAGYSTDGKANGTAMSVSALSKFFGLGMDDWRPSGVPAPQNPVIDFQKAPAEALSSLEKALDHAVSASYSIADDDAKLRAAPGDFEKIRGEYPLRREFPAYTVKIGGGFPEPASVSPGALASVLSGLGFRVSL
jgi:erythronate-4-phosphate dehydrogenase